MIDYDSFSRTATLRPFFFAIFAGAKELKVIEQNSWMGRYYLVKKANQKMQAEQNCASLISFR